MTAFLLSIIYEKLNTTSSSAGSFWLVLARSFLLFIDMVAKS